MRLRLQRSAVYLAMALSVASLVGGFALADLQLGQSTLMQQGSHSVLIGTVSGLSFGGVTLGPARGSPPFVSCAPQAPCDVSRTSITVCVGDLNVSATCSSDPWYEQTDLTTVAGIPLCGVAEITVYVTSEGNVTGGAPAFVYDSAGNLQENISLDYGIASTTDPAVPAPVAAVDITINVVCQS